MPTPPAGVALVPTFTTVLAPRFSARAWPLRTRLSAVWRVARRFFSSGVGDSSDFGDASVTDGPPATGDASAVLETNTTPVPAASARPTNPTVHLRNEILPDTGHHADAIRVRRC